MNWWDMLKNANISGKAKGKGTSFDASKIKINIDKKDCKEELKRILSKAHGMNLNKVAPSRLNKKFIDNELSEERACAFVKTLKTTLPRLQIRSPFSSTKFDVGAYPSKYVKYDSIMVRKMNWLVPESDERRVMVEVSVIGQRKELVDGRTAPTLFSKFTFATPEEYTKWVKSI